MSSTRRNSILARASLNGPRYVLSDVHLQLGVSLSVPEGATPGSGLRAWVNTLAAEALYLLCASLLWQLFLQGVCQVLSGRQLLLLWNDRLVLGLLIKERSELLVSLLLCLFQFAVLPLGPVTEVVLVVGVANVVDQGAVGGQVVSTEEQGLGVEQLGLLHLLKSLFIVCSLNLAHHPDFRCD